MVKCILCKFIGNECDFFPKINKRPPIYESVY